MTGNKVFYLTLVVEVNDDGYLVRCPAIQGAFAEGDTVEEAIFNCIDVVKMIADYRAERNETLGMPIVEWQSEMQVSFAIPVGLA